MTNSERIWRDAIVFAPADGIGGADSGGGDSGGGDSGGGDSGGGDSGGGGNVASGPVAAAPGVAIGLSPSRPQSDGTLRGDRWPPADVNPKQAHITTRHFSDWSWSDYYAAVASLSEFVAAKTADPSATPPVPGCWNTIVLPAIPTGTPLDDELSELADLVEFRPGLMAEALAQRNALVRYWQGMLAFNGASFPATTRLMEICLRVAQFSAMFYKNKYKRPRPSQLSPWLLPPLAVPGHASYPSGHATEGHLQALCLKKVLSDAATGGGSAVYNAVDVASIDLMANRIARNREVMGLHYRSDSEAGASLANALFPLMTDCPTISGLVAAAAAEWKRVVT